MRGLVAGLGLIALVAWTGCAKTHCDKLVAVACDHVADKDDGVEQCDRLKAQSENVPDDECQDILRLLEETGKLRTTAR